MESPEAEGTLGDDAVPQMPSPIGPYHSSGSSGLFDREEVVASHILHQVTTKARDISK